MKKYSNVFGKMISSGPDLGHLEQHDADEAVVPQELRRPSGERIRPVPERRQVGDRQVVDVERLVVALVAVEVEVGVVLEDRLVGGVDHERTPGSPAGGTAGSAAACRAGARRRRGRSARRSPSHPTHLATTVDVPVGVVSGRGDQPGRSTRRHPRNLVVGVLRNDLAGEQSPSTRDATGSFASFGRPGCRARRQRCGARCREVTHEELATLEQRTLN